MLPLLLYLEVYHIFNLVLTSLPSCFLFKESTRFLFEDMFFFVRIPILDVIVLNISLNLMLAHDLIELRRTNAYFGTDD